MGEALSNFQRAGSAKTSRSLTTIYYVFWTEVQITPCTLWELKKKKTSVLVSQPDWPLWFDCMSFTQVAEEQGDWNTGDPAKFHRLPESETERKAKLCWMFTDTESSLLKSFHALHFRTIFLIPFSCLHKRQHLDGGHIEKKVPKCKWD